VSLVTADFQLLRVGRERIICFAEPVPHGARIIFLGGAEAVQNLHMYSILRFICLENESEQGQTHHFTANTEGNMVTLLYRLSQYFGSRMFYPGSADQFSLITDPGRWKWNANLLFSCFLCFQELSFSLSHSQKDPGYEIRDPEKIHPGSRVINAPDQHHWAEPCVLYKRPSSNSYSIYLSQWCTTFKK
jgi:hypothetical protein